jgi:hypothetical protein
MPLSCRAVRECGLYTKEIPPLRNLRDFYRIQLNDPTILTAAERENLASNLYPFFVYILTQEKATSAGRTSKSWCRGTTPRPGNQGQQTTVASEVIDRVNGTRRCGYDSDGRGGTSAHVADSVRRAAELPNRRAMAIEDFVSAPGKQPRH